MRPASLSARKPLLSLLLPIAACIGAALPALVLAQEKADVPRVWIYRDVPAEGEEDNRTVPERHFFPFFYYPASKANKIAVDAKFPISEISPNEEGTCVEMFFELEGADDFAGAGFIPGDRLGDKPPLNIIDQGLVIGFGRPVHLKFRARTKANEKVRVRFECEGLAAGKVRGGIRPAQTPRPEVTVLGDSWTDVAIDLTKKAAGLEKVASPLRVVARSNENAGRSEITVYVDDVRFEVGRPVK